MPLDSSFHNKKIYIVVPEYKVEKILKGSLDLIQSPSPLVKIQIIAGESSLEV